MSQTISSALPAGVLFAIAMSITPGPNNMMLLASGINFGFRRTLPHLLGVGSGIAIMMVAVGLGLSQAFTRVPALYPTMEIASVAYLVYLAWKIATAQEAALKKADARPLHYYEAAAFQWVNPKAWMMVVTAATTVRVSHDFAINAFMMAAVLFLVGFPCIAAWAGFGMVMRRVLSRPSWRRLFNLAMALALLATTYPVIERALR